MIYFISDTHFYHNAIISYCHRPFHSVEDMNKELIKNWNDTVTAEDTVYFLGDFCLSNSEKTKDILNKLNGYKIIVRGNHCKDRGVQSLLNLGWDEAYTTPIEFRFCDRYYKIRKVLLSHEPIDVGESNFNIHGHIHGVNIEKVYPKLRKINHFDVSADNIGFFPISFSDIYIHLLEPFFLGKEIWKDIKGYEGLYQVSSYGRLRRLKNKEKYIIEGRKNKKGYLRVVLKDKNGVEKEFLKHRLIAQTFIPNPYNKPQVNHENGIKDDNHIYNLSWVTDLENKLHAWRNGIMKPHKIIDITPKTVIQYDLNGNFIKEYKTMFQAGKETGVDVRYISACCRNKQKTAKGYIWKYK